MVKIFGEPNFSIPLINWGKEVVEESKIIEKTPKHDLITTFHRIHRPLERNDGAALYEKRPSSVRRNMAFDLSGAGDFFAAPEIDPGAWRQADGLGEGRDQQEVAQHVLA